MLNALACSIAETAADVLGRRAAQATIKVSDEEIGLYFWHERGFRDHDKLVCLINHTREMIDRRQAEAIVYHRRPKPSRKRTVVARSPRQLVLDLVTA